MSHLGRWLTALVDGELDWAERDRVLNHLAHCEGCRQETNALRALKRRMTALGDHAGDEEITGRLIALARSSEAFAPAPHRAPGEPGRARRWIRRTLPDWKVVTGSAGLAATVLVVAAFLVGGGQPGQPTPRVTPAVDTYWLQHSYDIGQVPAASPAPAAPGPAASGGAPAPTTSAVAVTTPAPSTTPAAGSSPAPAPSASVQRPAGHAGVAYRSP